MAKTVLLAWELGTGLGHVTSLLKIGQHLARQGYQPHFVLRDVVGTRSLFNSNNFPVIQAPFYNGSVGSMETNFKAGSYADILTIHGFRNPDDLSKLVQAWQDILDTIRPDLIIAEHSPTLCLTAFQTFPVVSLGSGFTMPPVHLPEFPSLRKGTSELAQTDILNVICLVQNRRKKNSPNTLPELLNTEARFVCSLAELDPYKSIRLEPLYKPIESVSSPLKPPVNPRLFVYCNDKYEYFDDIIRSVAAINIPVSIYIQGRQTVLNSFLRTRKIRTYDHPPTLNEELKKSSIILSHGNHFTASAALIAGRPQILFPMHFEMDLTARALESIGVGVRIQMPTDINKLAGKLSLLSDNQDINNRAIEYAEIINALPCTETLSEIIQKCEEILI